MSNDFMCLVPAALAEMVDGQLQIGAADWLCIALTKAYDANATEDDRAQSIAAVSQLLDGARRRGFANTGAEKRCFESLAGEAMNGATAEEVAAAIGPLRRGDKQ
jgi:hypothetical protein